MGLLSIDPISDPRWPTLLAGHHSGLFHSSAWLGAVADAYGFTIRALVALDDQERPTAGLAFSDIQDLVGRRIISVPFSDVHDPLVRTPAEWDTLLASVQASGVPVQLRTLDNLRVAADPRLEVFKRARWHRLVISGSDEALWRRVAPATQRAIRKAERSGVVVRRLERDELAAFHRLHVGLRKGKYRLLAQPLRFFEAVANRFEQTGDWHPMGAFLHGRLIAATIYLRWRDTLYYKFNASALDALAVRPNSLLTWAGMELARTLGCAVLDLGPSDDDQPGLIRFKASFGAAESELRFLRWAPPGWNDERGQAIRRLLGDATRLFTAPEVPDATAAEAGTLLYRYFA